MVVSGHAAVARNCLGTLSHHDRAERLRVVAEIFEDEENAERYS